MEGEQLLLDGSVVFDVESLETAKEILASTEQQVYVPESVYRFVDDAGEYRDFQKSAPANFFGTNSVPPATYILDFLESTQIELYGPDSEEYSSYNPEDGTVPYSRIQDATQYYSQFAGYDSLTSILVEEFSYLFNSSIIIAAKDKISNIAERIDAVVARANENVREEVLTRSVQAHNLWNDHEEEFIRNYKLALIAVPLVNVNAAVGSGLAILEFLLEGAVSDRLVIALDP